jgi:hypothetical protein
MKPFFSIITPTIQRLSLVRLCESIDAQAFESWEHIIAVDSDVVDFGLMAKFADHRRGILSMGKRYNNYGNTPRHEAWEAVNAEWIWHVDDDNYLSDPDILLYLSTVLAKLSSEIKFAIFPILRHGSVFFNDPPGLCMTDTMNVIVRREVGRWPDGPEYTMDGIWVEALKARYKYAAFPDFIPIGVMEKSSEGK